MDQPPQGAAHGLVDALGLIRDVRVTWSNAQRPPSKVKVLPRHVLGVQAVLLEVAVGELDPIGAVRQVPTLGPDVLGRHLATGASRVASPTRRHGSLKWKSP